MKIYFIDIASDLFVECFVIMSDIHLNFPGACSCFVSLFSRFFNYSLFCAFPCGERMFICHSYVNKEQTMLSFYSNYFVGQQ